MTANSTEEDAIDRHIRMIVENFYVTKPEDTIAAIQSLLADNNTRGNHTYTLAEIIEALELSPGLVRSRITRGATLAEALRGKQFEKSIAEARIDETGYWLTLAQQSRDEHKPIAVINVKALIEQFEERLVELTAALGGKSDE